MACTITATAGSATANSYATIAEGDTYNNAHAHGGAWFEPMVSELDKCRALQTATKLLDYWFDWAGVAAGSTQALLWPRVGAYGANGYLLANDAIPIRIRDAASELARQLLASDRTADSDVETGGLSSLSVGSVAMTFRAWASSKPIPDAVMAIVGDLGTLRSKTGGAVSIRRA